MIRKNSNKIRAATAADHFQFMRQKNEFVLICFKKRERERDGE